MKIGAICHSANSKAGFLLFPDMEPDTTRNVKWLISQGYAEIRTKWIECAETPDTIWGRHEAAIFGHQYARSSRHDRLHLTADGLAYWLKGG